MEHCIFRQLFNSAATVTCGGVDSTRRCNQTKPAITHKVDLTTGHLVNLKTRHLHCTYSLGNITPIKCDWLLGELLPYKRPTNSKKDTVDWFPFQRRHSSPSAVVFSSQKVSYEELQHKFINVFSHQPATTEWILVHVFDELSL